MSWAELGGERVISGSILIPYFGALAADIVLASSATVPAQTTLTIGDLTLAVHVVRQASFAGSRSYRLVGGYGAWQNPITPRWYSSGAALPLSLVLGDAAREIGERVTVQDVRTIGSQYSRSSGPASRVLEQLAPDWWIAPDGVTHVGPRDSSPIATPATVIGYSGGKGKFEVATEDMGAWLPGRTFTSQTISDPQTIGATIITIDNSGKVRLDVLNAGALPDRLATGFDQLVSSQIPNLAYLVPWEYEVVTVNGSGPWSLDIRPTSTLCPLPGMTGLVCAQGAAGVRGKPQTGAKVMAGYRNGDPQRPYVVSYDGTTADEIDLVAGLSAGSSEHAASVEGVINVLQMLVSFMTPIAISPPLTPPTTPPWTDPTRGETIITILTQALLGAANPTAGIIEPTTVAPAIAAACAAKLPNPTGAIPSVAWPHVRGS